MPQRPRSHQLEDQSRLALGKALPAEWTVERVVHDYGVDLRVEIFSGGRPTGSLFFVQLKSTDRAPGASGISVRVSTDHLNYWNRLPVPTMIVLWTAATDTLFWKWAHHHLPDIKMPMPKTQSIRLSPSDRLGRGDAEGIAQEVRFCDRLRRGDLAFPVEVHVQLSGHRPDEDGTRVAFLAAWPLDVDRRLAKLSQEPGVEQLQVTLERRGFKVRLGRVARAMTWPSDEPLSTKQLVDEVASTLALLLGEYGLASAGADLLAEHGRWSRMVAISCPHRNSNDEWEAMLNPVSPIIKSQRFELGLDLVEAWRHSDEDTFSEAANGLLLTMKAFETRMPDTTRSRMNRLVAEDPEISFILEPDVQLQLAEIMANSGQESLAAEQYTLFTGGAENASEIDSAALEQMAKLHKEAGEYTKAITCLIELVRRDPGNDRRRLHLGVNLALDGRFTEAVVPIASVNDPALHGEAWAWGLTVGLAMQASGVRSQSRQPAAAEEVARRIEPGKREHLLALFAEAVARDALSAQTWRIHLALCAFQTRPPFGWEGAVPAALLAWADPDWWGLAIDILWRHGLVNQLLRATECALVAIGSEFPRMVKEGLPGTGFSDASLADLISVVAGHKELGRALQVKRIPGDGARYEIEQAPPSFRLFEVDVPPVEQWFEPAS
jgi:hypothetical protein